jgi:hypothetical protein
MMNDNDLNYRELMESILNEETNRRKVVQRLKCELSILENDEENYDVEKILAIVNELSIIDPSLNEEVATNLGTAKKKKFSFGIVKVAAACIALLIVGQVYTMAMGGNFLAAFSEWSNDMIHFITGRKIEIDGVQIWGSELRMYDSADEFFKMNLLSQ